MIFRLLFLALAAATLASRADAYSFTGPRWRNASVTIHLQLGATSGTLTDGFTSWGASAEDAIALWNANIGATRLNVVRDSTAARAEGNRLNNVFFSGDIYGDAWGSGVLAVTLTYTSGSSTTETDVLFNNRLNWNSYRGALRSGVQDFHRVALHEFGHALGLDHPDENGQSVTALMNSRVSSLDTLAADDIAGAQVLYGAPTAAIAVAAPVITAQPANRTAIVGSSASFTVGVTSTIAVTYQWLKNGAALAGATTGTLTFGTLTLTDAANYTVRVTNTGGTVTSAAATLTVNPAPTSGGSTSTTTPTNPTTTTPTNPITTTPTNPTTTTPATATLPTIVVAPAAQSVAAGERLTLSVGATGTGTLTYQWLKDGTALAGETNPSLIFAAVRPADAGNYSARVTNSAGSVTTTAVAVVVKFSRLVNLSTRAYVPAGTALTPGFYVRGTAAKSVLVRAVGPTLSLFGVGTALAEAKLDLIAQDTATIVASNNDWGGGTVLRDTFASVGAFPLAADSKDAAVQASLTPRGYTARVTTGDNTTSGITLAEIYDTEPLASSVSQLVNVSTLGFVGPGDQVLTAGFVISGNTTKRLLIRAVGPGLAPFGITNRLADPQLGLVPLGGSEPIATNDNWPNLVSLQAAFSAAGAFSLMPNSQDAALVITLEPGAYTVIVSGVSNTATGTALVEIYDLDP